MDSTEPTLREQRTEERTKTYQNSPPLLILFFVQQFLHQNNCRIDPFGIEFAMMNRILMVLAT
jgi:hypothetical protein